MYIFLPNVKIDLILKVITTARQVPVSQSGFDGKIDLIYKGITTLLLRISRLI